MKTIFLAILKLACVLMLCVASPLAGLVTANAISDDEGDDYDY